MLARLNSLEHKLEWKAKRQSNSNACPTAVALRPLHFTDTCDLAHGGRDASHERARVAAGRQARQMEAPVPRRTITGAQEDSVFSNLGPFSVGCKAAHSLPIPEGIRHKQEPRFTTVTPGHGERGQLCSIRF